MPFSYRECRECGEPFKPRHRTALFCSGYCKQTWNNRRQARGAELYDFAVVDPGNPIIGRLVDAYRAADLAKRDGRQSGQSIETALMSIPAAFGRDGDKR